MTVRIILCGEKLFATRKQTEIIICEWACDFYFELCIGRLAVSTGDDVSFFTLQKIARPNLFCHVR